MPRQVFTAFVPVGLIVFLSAALFGGFLTTCRLEWVQLVAREIQAACRDAGTQWMVVVCLLSYFVTFLILESRFKLHVPSSKSGANGDVSTTNAPSSILHLPSASRPRAISYLLTTISSPTFWLVGFVALVLLRYAVDYANAAKSLQVVVLLTGLVVGKGVALWASAARSFKLQGSSCKLGEVVAPSSILDTRSSAVLVTMTLLLAAAALWQPELGMEFHYRGVRRWEGVWDNPNTYGLLMGVGLTLAMGLLVQSLTSKVQSRKEAERHLTPSLSPDEAERGASPSAILHVPSSTWQRAINYLLSTSLLLAAALCAFGLLKSYSRGAWLGTGVALTWIIGSWVWGLGSGSSRVSWIRRNWCPSSILLLSIVVICFWQFRYTESPLLRRMFSVGNVNDFSWRNRVTAWQGAGHMMLDKPLLGFGWGKAEEVYRQEYRAARLEETAAIQLNDYLMLGTSAGVPALVCLLAYSWLGLRRSLVMHVSPLPAVGGASVLASRLVGSLAPPEQEGAHGVTRPSSNLQPSTAAAAGALVLLIGFWFDGGLFKLPTCVVFWILLELARCSSRSNEAQCRRDKTEGSSGDGPRSLTAKYTKHAKAETAFRWLAGMAAALAIGITSLHLVIPQLAVTGRTLSCARSYLISPRERADFDFLAARPIWSVKPLKTLLQHAHLANYNRELVNWKLDDSLYQSFVLSLEIDPAFDGGMSWRRSLWEHFYPRIRKEGSMETAAENVLRELRNRVKIIGTNSHPKTIVEMWEQGEASPRGLEVLSVAALRAAGIPARLPASGAAEFWNGTAWKSCTTSVPSVVR